MGYEISCEVCGQKNLESKYAGESGRNLFGSGCEYVSDFEKKRMNKQLWKPIVEKHQGDDMRKMRRPYYQSSFMCFTTLPLG